MGSKSSIFGLPVSVRKRLDRALMDGQMTLDQLHAFIQDCCAGKVKAPSRSALGRYALTFNEAAQALRENREVTRAMVQELGAESLEGEQGRLLVEIVRSLVFRAMHTRAADPDAKFSADECLTIARTLKDLSQAMHLEQDFAKRIREEARKKALDEMKEKLDTATASGGLDVAVAQEARRVLGFSDG